MLLSNRHRFVLAALLVGASSFSAAQSFGNAGFESPAVTPGSFRSGVDTPNFAAPWFGEHSFGIANGSGSWGTGAHSGSQYAYIQSTNEFGGAGSLYQTLTGLTAGQSYRVDFWMARRNGNVGGNTSNAIGVFADSTQILSPTTTGPNWSEFQTSFFTATSTSVKITFQGKVPGQSEDVASLIDDVRLVAQPVPEPSSMVALSLGFFALRRYRRNAR